MEEPRTIRLRPKPRLFAVLPTLLTLGNVICGFAALTIAGNVGVDSTGHGAADGAKLFQAALLIFAAMLFDVLDGRAARWTKQTTSFGAELDSLCDAVSFGVAPAFVLCKFCSAAPVGVWGLHPRLLEGIAALYVVCAMLRLARFNVECDEEDSQRHFSGLPTPAAAGAVVSFLVAYPLLSELASPHPPEALQWNQGVQELAAGIISALRIGLPLVMLGCACLMVSRVQYPHLFDQVFRRRRSPGYVLAVGLALFVAVLLRELSLPVIFCGFAFGIPLRDVVGRVLIVGRGEREVPPGRATIGLRLAKAPDTRSG